MVAGVDLNHRPLGYEDQRLGWFRLILYPVPAYFPHTAQATPQLPPTEPNRRPRRGMYDDRLSQLCRAVGNYYYYRKVAILFALRHGFGKSLFNHSI